MPLFEDIAARGRITRSTRDTPAHVQEQVARFGGENIHGQPLYIVEWGWNHLEWSGGMWTNRDASGNIVSRRVELRRAPMCRKKNRWHVFKWQSAGEFAGPMGCTPELWARQHTQLYDGIPVQELGPFPARGWYVDCFTIEQRDWDPVTETWSANARFADLTADIVRRVIKNILDDKQYSYEQRMIVRKAEKQAEEDAIEAKCGELAAECAIPAHTNTPRRAEHLLADFYRNKRIQQEKASVTVIN